MKRIAWGLLAALLAFAAPARADWPDQAYPHHGHLRARRRRRHWARIIAEPLSKALGQSVVAENRAAAAASSPRRRSPAPSRTGTPS